MPAVLTRHAVMTWAILLLAGCGQTTSSTTTAESSTPSPAGTTEGAATPTAAPAAVDAAATEQVASAAVVAEEPVEGSPEWALQQIMQIRLLPLPVVDVPAETAETTDGPDGVVEASATQPVQPGEADKASLQAQLANNREIRKERNKQVVSLAMTAIAKTAKDPAKEEIFLEAVQQMLDARLQLALQGDEESIAALYDAAEAFYAKMPESPAAAKAQASLLNLSHANALRYAKTEQRWLQEFSRNAQLYATRFPSESAQALPQLVAAGRSCELNGLIDEAKSCFALVQTKYPESPQATQVAGILRRLQLVGQKLEFAGPTLDGNYVSIDDCAGKTVVIVFWATNAAPFVQKSTALQTLTDKYKKYVQVLSVNLDSEEPAVDSFIEKANLTWPVIFHAEHDKRGWNAPLAAYYGVTSLPAIWIVDPNGVVAETAATPETLEARLREVIVKHRESATSSTPEKKSGESPTRS